MKWSVSSAKIFQKCQRQWYYGTILAHHSGKSPPTRREAFLLKQCSSIFAWRGKIVDKVIQDYIVPKLIYDRSIPNIEKTLSYAKDLAKRQLEFGKANRHREEGIVKSKCDDIYCAFFDVEYNGGLKNEQVKETLEDIAIALKNLLESNLIKEILSTGSRIFTQKSLSIKYDVFTVSGTPDLVVFFPNKPPLIIDWKCHKNRSTDFWLQLGVYAFILSQVDIYKYFWQIPGSETFNAEDVRVIEFQLLLNEPKEYTLTLNDIGDVEDFIYSTGKIMKEFYDERKLFDHNLFQLAVFSSQCRSCQFQKLCMEDGYSD